MMVPHSSQPTTTVNRESGSALVPVVSAMLILLIAGISLSELFGAQRMQSVLSIESTQAYWTAEAGIWHAAWAGADITTPTAFGGGTYTVSISGNDYTSTGIRGAATRTVDVTLDASSSGSSSFPSPIAHWNLDESSGSTAQDSIGSNDGTLRNGPSFGSTGTAGTSLTFDGSDDYVEIPHANEFLLDGGAISLWFRSDDVSGRQELFSKDSSYYDTGGHVTMMLNGDDVEVRFQSTSTSYYVDSGSMISALTWTHVVFTFGSDGMRLYVDGVLADIDSYTGGMGSTSGGIGNHEPIALGANTWQSGDLVVTPTKNYYDGRIDAVSIFSTQLDATQVATLFAAGGTLP